MSIPESQIVQKYMNVQEAWNIYDTILVCRNYYGKESGIDGWYTSFSGFAQQQIHQFFKSRTAGSTHLAYNNQNSADNIDFAFTAYSFGIRFFAPVVPESHLVTPPETRMQVKAIQEALNAFWLFDLPRHCGVDLRVQQDVILENTCMATPPGYGPRGGGGAQSANFDLEHYILNTEFTADAVPYYWWQQQAQDPWQITIGSQSEPVIDCRFLFPNPIKIPRNTTIEANLYLSPYARYILENLYNGTWNLLSSIEMNSAIYSADPPGPYIEKNYTAIPTRWGIQASLYGLRAVQQRGQYHAPGAITTE